MSERASGATERRGGARRRLLGSRALGVLVGLAVLMQGPAGDAAPNKRAQAKKQFEQAEKFYKLGEFQKAADHYAKAYELTPLSPLLFNLGQCYKQVGNCERAVFYYETYLREKPDAPNAQLASDLLDECRRTLEGAAATPAAAAPAGEETPVKPGADADNPAPATSPPAGDRPAQPGTPAPLVAPTTPVSLGMTSAMPPPVAHEESVLTRWWFWGIVAGVTVAAVGGTVYYLKRPQAETVPPSGSLGTIDTRSN